MKYIFVIMIIGLSAASAVAQTCPCRPDDLACALRNGCIRSGGGGSGVGPGRTTPGIGAQMNGMKPLSERVMVPTTRKSDPFHMSEL